ncbi:hypothetical protein, partial [Marinomonas polaris]|uniref:hypothetical protein n=1 Tax=Marinomonas polaris TaxID=293552 RepID=UPI003F94A8F2
MEISDELKMQTIVMAEGSMNDEGINKNASKESAGKIIATVVLWLEEQSPQERWDLSDEQMCVLLGGITVSTWNQWKETAQIND